MVQICVTYCHYYSGKIGKDGKRVSLFNFPKKKDNSKMKKIWLRRIRRQETRSWKETPNTKVCSDHFLESDFLYRGFGHKWNNRRLKPFAVPSRFKWSKVTRTRNNPFEKKTIPDQQQLIDSSTTNTTTTSTTIKLPKQSKQQELIVKLREENLKLSEEFQRLRVQVDNLSDQIKILKNNQFNYERFKDNDKDIRFYTSFPSHQVLELCFNFLNPGGNSENIKCWHSSITQTEDQMKNTCEEEDLHDTPSSYCKRGR